MKELCKYKCEHCNTEYAEKNRAIECEENHKIKLKCKEKGYLPYHQDHSGYPLYVNIGFEDGKTIRYKRT